MRRGLGRILLTTCLVATSLAVAGVGGPPAAAAPGGTSTIAGTGTAGYAGDGDVAVAAQLNSPSGTAVDGAGNVYLSDSTNDVVRRIDAETGEITTIAGTGVAGYSGDGGPATAAQLYDPWGVAIDPDGDVVIADRFTGRVRHVDQTTGVITTIAGTGASGYSGDGGPAVDAEIGTPLGLAFDPSGNLFVAAGDGHVIRRIDTEGTITTAAGTGVAGFSGDGGPATEAQIAAVYGLDVDAAGNLYIADGGNHRIRRVDAVTGVITTVAGTGVAGYSGDGGLAIDAEFNDPLDIEFDSAGNLFVGDTFNRRVRRIDTAGVITTVAGTGTAGYNGDGVPATDFRINPFGIAVDAADNILVAERNTHRIRRVEPPAPGQLRVTTSPALPAEIVVDGVARDSWGLTWVDFPPGAHEVCFGAMPGFTPPPCQQVVVLSGQITNVVGTYTPRGYLRVLTAPAVPSTITVDGIERNDWGVWTEVEPGSYEVCFGAVADYDPPPCEQAVVSGGSTTTVTGEFAASPGAPSPTGAFGFLRATTDPAVGSRISIDGEWRDSWGLTWLKIPAGAHEICFESVLYADGPECDDIVVAIGATVEVQGSFAPHGFLRVITDPAVGATILVDGAPANAWGVWTSKPPETYQVCFGAVPGMVSPACEVAEVSTGETTTLTGVYLPAP